MSLSGRGLALGVVIALACSACAAPAERFTFSEPHMGTDFHLVMEAADRATAERAARAAFERVKRLNGILSDWDGESELSRLCRSPVDRPTAVSEELWEVLGYAQELAVRSGGAFDVTVGPLVRLWRRARRQQTLPLPSRRVKAAESVGYEHVELDPATPSVTLRRAGMRLDLGGIAKGFTAREALRTLAAHGVTRALVDAGGDLALGDPPRDAAGWVVGLAPLAEGEPPTEELLLANVGIATSGDAFRYVEIEGVRYSHIIDPRTGLGVVGRASVTVVAADPMVADALASAVSVLGADAGLALVATVAGAAARVVVIEGGTPVLRASPGFPGARPVSGREWR